MKKTNLFKAIKICLPILFMGMMHMGMAQQNISVGTGTDTTWANAVTPFSTNFKGGKHQYLVPAAWLINNNAQAGDLIGLGFNIVDIPATAGVSGMKIKISTTTSNTVPSSFVTNAQGATVVYNNSGTTTIYPTLGWNYFTFSSPYAWNGTDNLIVQVCYNNSASAGGNYGILTAWAGSKVKGSWSSVTAGCNITGYGTTGWAIPNMRFQFPQPPANDIGVTALISPSFPVCAMDSLVKVKIMNEGIDTLESATLNWSINGTLMTPATFAGNVPQFGYDTATLGTVPGGLNDGDSILVWSTMPNSIVDSNTTNDTLLSVVYNSMNGTYSIDSSGTGDFISFNEALARLEISGVCGPVVFSAIDSLYNEQLVLKNYMGLSDSNTVTFRSTAGIKEAVKIQFAGTGSSSNYVVKFKNTKYINFENISLQNKGTTYARVLTVASTSDNSKNISFNNCDILGRWTTSTSSYQTVAYLYSREIKNWSFDRCKFSMGSTGLYVKGTNSTSRAKNIKVSHSEFIGQRYMSIYGYYVEGFDINDNYFYSNSTASSSYAMYLYYISGGEIQNNFIPGTATWPRIGMRLYNINGGLNDYFDVANNRVYITAQNGLEAIYLYGGTFINVMHNTLTTRVNAAKTLHINGGNYNFVKNNSLQTLNNGWAIYTVGNGIYEMDYNNLSAPGPTAKFAYNGSNRLDLAAWQNATGFDANSLTVDSVITDTTQMRICNDSLFGKGTYLADFPMDFEGESRHAQPCIGADEFLPILQVDYSNLPPLCDGDSMILEQNYFTSVVWDGTQQSTGFLISTPGNYQVSVQGVCGIKVENFTVSGQVDVMLNDTHLCAGETTMLATGITNGTYLWSDGSTDSLMYVDSAQVVYINATDAHGCQSTDSAIITQSGIVQLAETMAFCEDDFVTITPGINGTYVWNDGTTGSVKNATQAGTYSVTVTELHCVSSDSTVVTEILKPTSSFTDSSSVFTVAFTNLSINATSYTWDFGDGDSSNLENPIHLYPYTPEADTVVTVTLIAINECGTDQSFDSQVRYGNLVSVSEVDISSAISIYPNPTNGTFYVQVDANDASPTSMRITNIQGRVIQEMVLDNLPGNNTQEVDITNQASGIYFITVTINDQSAVYRIIKK